jgi:hypothetical protein
MSWPGERDLAKGSGDVRKHGHSRLCVAGAVKMLIHEESNHGGHCNSHDRNDYDRNLIFP